jgi:hypothetical protein
MNRNEDELVWLDPNRGSHYHRKGCCMIDNPAYIPMPLKEASVLKGKGWYKPCACMYGIANKELGKKL